MNLAIIDHWQVIERLLDQKDLAGGVKDSGRSSYPSELALQAAWAKEHLRPIHLSSGSNTKIEILTAGRWNREAGPDFLGASIRVDGITLKVDIELHLNAEDWNQHQHAKDPRYQYVMLWSGRKISNEK